MGDHEVQHIVIDGAGERAFCAGGDVALLGREGRQNRALWETFFHDEYRMNQAIARCGKPWVALIDGITMGGGVGLSIHGPYSIATERTLFAMPETGIGLIPDVGGTHALAKLPGEIGTWLALTGARLKAADLRYCGIATHYLPSAHLPTLCDLLATSHEPLAEVLATFDENAGEAPLAAYRDAIDYHFIQCVGHAADGCITIRAEADQFGDQRVIVRWHGVTAVQVGIDANADASRRVVQVDLAGARNKRNRIFGANATFDGMAIQVYLLLLD
jgi:enoyl-CoA hydratase/carnithine racemase